MRLNKWNELKNSASCVGDDSNIGGDVIRSKLAKKFIHFFLQHAYMFRLTSPEIVYTWTVYGDDFFASEILNRLPHVVSWVGELLQTDRYPPELEAQLMDMVDMNNFPGKI